MLYENRKKAVCFKIISILLSLMIAAGIIFEGACLSFGQRQAVFIRNMKHMALEFMMKTPSRIFPRYMVELCTGGELNSVHFVGREEGVADTDAPVNWCQSRKQ